MLTLHTQTTQRGGMLHTQTTQRGGVCYILRQPREEVVSYTLRQPREEECYINIHFMWSIASFLSSPPLEITINNIQNSLKGATGTKVRGVLFSGWKNVWSVLTWDLSRCPLWGVPLLSATCTYVATSLTPPLHNHNIKVHIVDIVIVQHSHILCDDCAEGKPGKWVV